MYDELVKRLRDWPKICAQREGSIDQLHDEAADAIEELQKRVPKTPHGRLIDIDAPYQIQVHVDGLTKKGSIDIYAPAVLEADPAEEGET